jgi:hypothetical protein
MEKIIDQRVRKKTQRKTYFEYLVKWKIHPIEDASWESEINIQRHGDAANTAGVHEFSSQRSMMQEHHKQPTKQARMVKDSWKCTSAHFESVLKLNEEALM